MTLAYNYDPRTGIYAGSEEATPDPRNPGQFIIPAHSTLDAPPPLEEGQQAVFVDSAWQVQAAPTPQQVAEQTAEQAEAEQLRRIEAQAKYFLIQSDWAMLPDVSLANHAEWVAYRAALRAIAINPTTTSVIPPIPPKVWS
jgi:hypothetical protein